MSSQPQLKWISMLIFTLCVPNHNQYPERSLWTVSRSRKSSPNRPQLVLRCHLVLSTSFIALLFRLQPFSNSKTNLGAPFYPLSLHDLGLQCELCCPAVRPTRVKCVPEPGDVVRSTSRKCAQSYEWETMLRFREVANKFNSAKLVNWQRDSKHSQDSFKLLIAKFKREESERANSSVGQRNAKNLSNCVRTR